MRYVGRFAPSPTGPLHFGSLVACLASFLDARAAGGRWLLRMEDLDRPRCHDDFARQIPHTLERLGFQWDGEIMVQSQRTARYQAVLDRLHSAGWTYACGCSRREIADSTSQGIDGPIYPGTCRNKKLAATGNAIRIRTRPGLTEFEDRVQGPVAQRVADDIGDFVLRRRDNLLAYQLAVVVDDADQGVTAVVRGADLLDSTPRQIFLQNVLGLREPVYMHIPIAVNAAGQKLSKQTLAPAVDDEIGCELLNRALQFLGQPAILGTLAEAPALLLAQAVTQWDPATIPRSRLCHIP
jgi:glutamyl-Q tRNA(Asp) synthetase